MEPVPIPNSTKRKNERMDTDMDHDDDEDLSSVWTKFSVKPKDESRKVWVHFDSPEKLSLEDKRTQRDCFLHIFSTFGFIKDFYIPLSVDTEVSYCFIEYKEPRNAYTACKLFDGNTNLLDLENIALPLVPKELKERAAKILSRITLVELASSRGLMYSNRSKRRKRFENSMETTDSPSPTSKNMGGMITIEEVADLERHGEDISDFQVPKSENISEVPLPDAPLTIGYFKGVFL